MEAQPKGLAMCMTPSPIGGDEAQRCAALLEAGVLQRHKLIRTGQHQDAHTNDPGPGAQHRTLLDDCMQEPIAKYSSS
jgi:hypothetical protein